MRTTITLDPDVAVRLQRLVRERSLTFKEAVNSTLRAGFDADAQERRHPPYVLPTFSMGVPLVDLTKANQLAAALEDEEVVRKMALGK
jgi:hypothetical protein